MTEPKNTETRISGVGILMMIIGIAGILFFGWQISEAINGVTPMEEAATSMSKLKSRSGESVAEAYYDDHGDYLKGEAAVYGRITLGIDVIGMLVSVLVFAYGGSKKTLVEAIAVNYSSSKSPKSTKAPKARAEIEEEEEDL